jgi:ASCH domain
LSGEKRAPEVELLGLRHGQLRCNQRSARASEWSMRALSIRRPYAEQILRGTKKIEYRTRPTSISERAYIYGSLRPRDPRDFESTRLEPGDLPTGVLVGTVKIVDRTGRPGDYKWHLKRPRRLRRKIRPREHPQPAWFNPF